MAVLMAVGAAFLVGFLVYIRSQERAGKEPLLSTGLFRSRTSNLGLVTQNMQWLVLHGGLLHGRDVPPGGSRLQRVKTGLIFTAATLGILVSSLAAERLAKRYAQRTLIVAGFVVTVAGIGLLIGLVYASDRSSPSSPGSR